MNVPNAIESLRQFGTILKTLVNGLTDAQIRFRPESGNWSILEILCHLADEEKLDFPARIKLTLAGSQPWPSIDPEGWAKANDYQSQDFKEALDLFLSLRQSSIDWLEQLSDTETDWNLSYPHPQLGTIRAGDLLFSWAAHDLLHLKQITKRLFEYNLQNAGPYEIGYAGSW